MKRLILYIIFISQLCFALETYNLSRVIYDEEINLVDVRVEDFLIFLSKEGGVSILSTKGIKDERINMYIDKNKSLETILEIFCKTNGYEVQKTKSYILVKEEEKTNRGRILGEVLSLDYKERLDNVEISLLDENLNKKITSEDGVFIMNNLPYGGYFLKAEKEGYEVSGEIIDINNKEERIRIYMEKKYESRRRKEVDNGFVIEKLKIGNLENIKIEDILDESLKEGLKFTRDNKKGILYISGRREKVGRTKKYIEDLSCSNKSIRISVQVIDVNDNLFDELGFSWVFGENKDGENKNGLVTGGILNNSFAAGIGSIFSSTINYINTFNNNEEYLSFGFNLLEATQDLKMSSTPSIVTINGEEGVLKVTEERIVGQEKIENEDVNKTSYVPIFKEAGIVFRITPEILKNDYLSLKVSMESSDFRMLDYGESVGDDEESIYGSKVARNIETTIRMKNGELVFIGGLQKGIIQTTNSKLKYLSEIPVIGFLFNNDKKVKEVSNLYIKLKADIVENKSFQDAGIEVFDRNTAI